MPNTMQVPHYLYIAENLKLRIAYISLRSYLRYYFGIGRLPNLIEYSFSLDFDIKSCLLFLFKCRTSPILSPEHMDHCIIE